MRWLTGGFLFFLALGEVRSETDIYQSYAWFSFQNNANQSLLNQRYDMLANTIDPDLDGNVFGIFDLNDSSNLLTLHGAQAYVSDTGPGYSSGSWMYLAYRIFEYNQTPGSFSRIGIGYSGNYFNNRIFTDAAQNINLLSGLEADKTYRLQMYLYGRSSMTGGGSVGVSDTNGGSYYTATFATPEPSSASLLTFALSGLLALRRRKA